MQDLFIGSSDASTLQLGLKFRLGTRPPLYQTQPTVSHSFTFPCLLFTLSRPFADHFSILGCAVTLSSPCPRWRCPRLGLLDINQDGFLQRNELLVASAPELKLFDFRRPRGSHRWTVCPMSCAFRNDDFPTVLGDVHVIWSYVVTCMATVPRGV